MNLRVRGVWTLSELRTALFHELRAIEDRGAKQIRGATIHLNLVDDRGAPVTLHHRNGQPIKNWPVETLYHSAADDYEP